MVRHLTTSYRWNLVMCSTGPSLLTATARQALFEAGEGGEKAAGMRMTNKDFRDYGGKFKAVSTRVSQQSDHYMKNLQKDRGLALLRDYAEEVPLSSQQLQALEGRAVQGHNGKSIYFLGNGTKRAIPNMDTFQALQFSPRDIWVITDFQLQRVPEGEHMPPLDWDPKAPWQG